MQEKIYGLFDPRDPEWIMYVGKGSAKRAESHWKFFLNRGLVVNALLRRWFESLKAAGIAPGWRFLEENVIDWQARERFWIKAWRAVNPMLCNVADGGNTPFLSVEERREVGRRGALISGWREVNKCYPNLSREAGRLGGFRLKELHPEIAHQCGMNPNSQAAFSKSKTVEHQRAACAKGGWREAHRRNPGKASEWGRKGAALGTVLGHHIRWHSHRGLFNPSCDLCLREYAFRSDFGA